MGPARVACGPCRGLGFTSHTRGSRGASGRWLLQLPLTFCLILFGFGCAGSSLPHGLFPVAEGGSVRLSRSPGSGAFRLPWFQVPGSSTGSVAEAHGLSCSKACGTFPGQGLNLCLLRPQDLSRQGSPCLDFCCLARLGLPGGSDGKESACSAGDLGSIPGWGRSPGEGHSNPLQYSCLGNPMDRGAWPTAVRGFAKSQTGLSS